jgi:ABC-2 type transport system ATP-binding protein
MSKISKAYGSKKAYYALKNIDLEIRKGEIFGMLGPNGAGKTTLIGILSGVLAATDGEWSSWGIDGNTRSSEIRKFTNVCP